MRLGRPVAAALLVLCVLVVLWLALQSLPGGGAGQAWAPEGPSTAYAEDAGEGPSGTDTRDWDDVDACRDDVLPAELEEVSDDIEAGGPFDHDRDGITFQNREGYLPQESGGYYREYTVETSGLDHRGARRVVTGGGESDPEVWYYTDDHYESFCEFAP